MQISVIGLGLMGQALAGAFLTAGHETTVWNRTASKAEPLVAQGAKAAGSVAEAVAASELVVLCVTDYAAARELLDPLELTGRAVVNLTSGTAEQARSTAEWAASRGAAYLDGAIMAIPQAIATDEAVVLYSGPGEVFDRHQAALSALGGQSLHLGEDHGLASLYDVALLGVMWSVLNGFLHGAAMLTAAGVEASAFASLAGPTIGTVAGWLPGYAEQIDKKDFTATDATIATHLAAMDHLVEESEVLGVDPGLPGSVREIARRAVAAGREGESYAALIDQFRTPSGARS
ncbi:NAD(P)-dependent oxidoreductase [Nonomuraea soli]|uniref:3-hydroxyisobutyrate dehydrogenase-like beta-hydroxyacid dehydrogenase n=1 Tax=Nonomuraea soli TaxID=1032476 RepID=A0A7W0HRE8_9ACTN|nr:NAD(P)-binding domain-containing protein [Nonomuraea soli]MBA2892928.1 3-hydroxyisobutyrate dehydrogenase-like beta-hydroxyacid dehydrogenase [Nonomuraea soli]